MRALTAGLLLALLLVSPPAAAAGGQYVPMESAR